MALGAVVGAALHTPATLTYGLFMDGLSLLKQPGSSSNRYGVLIDSIELHEAGPGQVSELRFIVDDPSNAVTVLEGALVRYVDHRVGTPLFLGWVQTRSYRVSGTGRTIEVTAIGVEAWLDWAYFPGGSWEAGTTSAAVAQALMQMAVHQGGAPSMRSGGAFSDLTTPVYLVSYYDPDLTAVGSYAVPAGSIRQALEYVVNAAAAYGMAGGGVWKSFAPPTVDYYGNVRIGPTTTSPPWTQGYKHNDWNSATGLVISTAGPKYPTNLEYTIDPISAMHGVYVTGSGVAGLVTDGTGLVGQVGTLQCNATTLRGIVAAGQAFLTKHREAAHGAVTLSELLTQGAPGAEWHAGSYVVLTSPQHELSSTPFSIGAIDKRFFSSGTEEWIITFGGEARSFATMVRRLTRAVL